MARGRKAVYTKEPSQSTGRTCVFHSHSAEAEIETPNYNFKYKQVASAGAKTELRGGMRSQ